MLAGKRAQFFSFVEFESSFLVSSACLLRGTAATAAAAAVIHPFCAFEIYCFR